MNSAPVLSFITWDIINGQYSTRNGANDDDDFVRNLTSPSKSDIYRKPPQNGPDTKNKNTQNVRQFLKLKNTRSSSIGCICVIISVMYRI